MRSEPQFTAVCLMVQCTREEICSSTPAAQLHLWIYVSIEWQDVLNWVARPMTLLIALIFRMYPLSLNLSLTQTDIRTHSQLGSLQLVPMVIIISRFPSVYLWTVQEPMHIAVCKCIHFQAYKHRDKQTHRFEVCYLPSVLPAAQMLHFSPACYINRAVVHASHTPCHWSLSSYPDRSTGHTKCNCSRPHTDQCYNQQLQYKSDTNSSTYIFTVPVYALYRWLFWPGCKYSFDRKTTFICAWDWCMNK